MTFPSGCSITGTFPTGLIQVKEPLWFVLQVDVYTLIFYTFGSKNKASSLQNKGKHWSGHVPVQPDIATPANNRNIIHTAFLSLNFEQLRGCTKLYAIWYADTSLHEEKLSCQAWVVHLLHPNLPPPHHHHNPACTIPSPPPPPPLP